MSPPAASNHFPPDVRLMLQRAAQTPISGADPFARAKAINRAIEKARLMFPGLFKENGDAEARGSE